MLGQVGYGIECVVCDEVFDQLFGFGVDLWCDVFQCLWYQGCCDDGV